jgi:GrpB-like predicted nucleotidyltransferase (UPF0157 family)
MWDPVRLAHHDPRWKQEFEQTRSSILMAAEGWVSAVEHVGSTAVPELIAVPVIDVVAGILDPGFLEEAAVRLEGLNFRRLPLPLWAGDCGELLVKPRQGNCTHVIYLTVVDGVLWRRLTAMRDRLLEHPDEALRFEDAKVHRWRRCGGTHRIYDQAKGIYFTHLEEQMSAAKP